MQSNLSPSELQIDSHQHFWKFNPVRDAWITEEMKVIQRDFYPTDLVPLLKQNGIDGCVSVQADQSEEETVFLLQHANENNFIKGVVGWVDLQSKNASHRISHFANFKKLKGFRHVAQAESNGFLVSQNFLHGIRLLKNFNLTYDILIYPHQLEDALELVNKFPNQKFVIDHIAKPVIRNREFEHWAKYMLELSACANVFCKLSGMVTEANWKSWTYHDLIPYMDCVVENFGANRVMYGSDWPVCLLAASYEQQLSVVQNYITNFTSSEKQQIMGENAIRFYNL
jgi:L-fuconolactonase